MVPVPAGDEGWVEPAPTQPASSSSPNPPMYLPETLMRWNGWSLVAPRPGKHIDDASDDSLEDDTGNPPPPGSNFQAADRVRGDAGDPAARCASGAATASGPGSSTWPATAYRSPLTRRSTYATPPAVYGRVEPLASPVVVPCAPRTPGESLETIVIRSNYDIPDSSPLIVPSERHLAPPASSRRWSRRTARSTGPTAPPKRAPTH